MLNYLSSKILRSKISGSKVLLSTLLPSIAIISPLLLTAAPGFAQNEQQTICRYDPDSGFPNALGMRTYVTLTESSGSTTVVLEQFPRAITNPEATESGLRDPEFNTDYIRADISEVRSLTFYNTPIAATRQILLDQPFYYATLLDIGESDLDTEGFAAIDQTLSCRQVETETETETTPDAEAEVDPAAETPIKTPSATPTIADLPNGNYRFASADFDNVVVSDEDLAAAGGEVFLFRKFGDTITGEMRFLDETGGVFCIGGKVDGNVITGNVASPSDRTRSSDFLREDETGEQSVEASLNLSTFSRINAGNQLPIEACLESTYE